MANVAGSGKDAMDTFYQAAKARNKKAYSSKLRESLLGGQEPRLAGPALLNPNQSVRGM